MGYQWQRDPFEFTNDSELYHGNRVPFVPRYGAGSGVNGVIDTRAVH